MGAAGQIAGMVLDVGSQIYGPIVGAVAGPAESAIRKDAFAERDALKASMGSGLTTSQRQRFRSEALSGIDAQQQSALAGLARGSANSDGESGMKGAAQRDIYRAGASAANQAMSSIRDLDQQQYMARKAASDAKMKLAYDMGMVRKNAATMNASDGGASGMAAGQAARTDAAAGISAAVKNYKGGAGGAVDPTVMPDALPV